MASSSAETTPQARVLDFLRLVVVELEGSGRLGAIADREGKGGKGVVGSLKEGGERAQLSFPSFARRYGPSLGFLRSFKCPSGRAKKQYRTSRREVKTKSN